MEKNFMRVDEVAEELDVSRSYAYKIVRDLNKEMEEKGYLTVCGRVNRKYFMKKFCYGETEGE
jgi:predicted transcriptional regulator